MSYIDPDPARAAFHDARHRAIDEFMSNMAALNEAFDRGEINQQEVLIDSHHYANRLRQDVDVAQDIFNKSKQV